MSVEERVTEVTVPVEIVDSDPDLGAPPSRVVSIPLDAFIAGGRWTFDSVLSEHQDQVNLLFYPAEDDAGWDRLDDVGDW